MIYLRKFKTRGFHMKQPHIRMCFYNGRIQMHVLTFIVNAEPIVISMDILLVLSNALIEARVLCIMKKIGKRCSVFYVTEMLNKELNSNYPHKWVGQWLSYMKKKGLVIFNRGNNLCLWSLKT